MERTASELTVDCEKAPTDHVVTERHVEESLFLVGQKTEKCGCVPRIRAQTGKARASLSGIRCAALWEGFATKIPANPSKVGVLVSAFFEPLNLAVIVTVVRHVNVHID